MFQKQAFADFRLGVLQNLVNSTGKHLPWSLFLIKVLAKGSATLLKRNFNTVIFLVKLAKFLKTPFLQRSFGFVFPQEFGAKTGVTVINSYHIHLKKVFVSAKIQKQPNGQHRFFSVNIAKFLTTPILKIIRERLLLRISTSVTNLLNGGISWILSSF